jgi:hypothetical protein
MSVERLKCFDNIVALPQEPGCTGDCSTKWQDQLEPIDDGEGHRQTPASVNCGKKSRN